MTEKSFQQVDQEGRVPAIDHALQQFVAQPTVSLEQALAPFSDSLRNLLALAEGCGT